MKKAMLVIFCLLLAVPAMAKEAKKKIVTESMVRSEDEIGKGSMLRKKKKEKAKAEKKAPVISEKDCQYLTAYQPDADGNAEYKPGVDAQGKPVMEADITPSVIQPPEKVTFDITEDVARYTGLHVPPGTITEAKIGTIVVEKGRMTFNGQPLEGEEEAALRALCFSKDSSKAPK